MPLVQIFAKAPVEGKVKTRLIPQLGAARATEVYRYLLQFTLDLLHASTFDYQVWLAESSNLDIFRGENYRIQKGSNLGNRMVHALIDGHNSNPGESILLIGSDCLDLTETHLIQANESLTQHDLVFLPSLDGGFAMIGCRNINRSIFDGVKWSSETVLQQALANAGKLNYRVDLLETVRDIDTLDDLNHYPQLRELIACP